MPYDEGDSALLGGVGLSVPQSLQIWLALDWQVQTDKGEIGVCCKSVKGSYTLQQLSALPAYRPLVLIVNRLREVPITKRPQLSQQFLEAARDAGVQVVDSRELLQKAIVGRTEPVDVGL